MQTILLRGARVYRAGAFTPLDVLIQGGVVAALARGISPERADAVFSMDSLSLFPGFVDAHTHLREPGFLYKETMKSGTRAAARGGYTAVCAMPNLRPAPDCLANLRVETDAAARDARVRVLPYGALTVGQAGGGELAAYAEMADFVCGFSDDGRGVQSDETARRAMEALRGLDALFAAHCEVDSLARGGVLHDGRRAREMGLPGIPSESEWAMLERDLRLARETGCRYHACHLSTAESVERVRRAKADGARVTCETAPHYLLLTEDDIEDDGRFKMNPPLRAARDRAALREGLKDGTIDCIATDHAPHSAEEKSGGLARSLMGVVGLETAFPMLYEELVAPGILPLERVVRALTAAPRAALRLDGGLAVGQRAELTAWDLSARYRVDPGEFLSMGRATPFTGRWARGKCEMTLIGDRFAYAADGFARRRETASNGGEARENGR